jgi:hypothetical protein
MSATLIVVLKGQGEVVVYSNEGVMRAELVDEELEEENGEEDVSDFLTIKPINQLPKEYCKRFNIVNTDPRKVVKHRR